MPSSGRRRESPAAPRAWLEREREAGEDSAARPELGRADAYAGTVPNRVDLIESIDVASESKSQSRWVVMARTPDDLGGLVRDGRWAPPQGVAQAPLWTDDFSNILSVLSLR